MLTLKGGFSKNPRLAPLLDGTVQVSGVDIHWEIGNNPGAMFAQQLRFNAYDLFEFSISDYINIRARHSATWDWTAIPVFFSKALLQLNTWVNVRSGISGAGDLKHKGLAVGDYTQTAFLWFRAMVDRLYGIRSQDIAWYNGRVGEDSHSVLLGLKDNLPPGVSITFLDRDEAANELLQSGEIDAACATSIPIDTESSNVRRLFPDRGKGFVEDFFRSVGFTPVNHTVVIQRRVVERNPWLPEALFEAFEHSKREAYRRNPATRRIIRERDGLELDESVFGPDPFASGLSANRAMLSMAVDQSLKDGLIQDRVDVDEFYWESMRRT